VRERHETEFSRNSYVPCITRVRWRHWPATVKQLETVVDDATKLNDFTTCRRPSSLWCRGDGTEQQVSGDIVETVGQSVFVHGLLSSLLTATYGMPPHSQRTVAIALCTRISDSVLCSFNVSLVGFLSTLSSNVSNALHAA